MISIVDAYTAATYIKTSGVWEHFNLDKVNKKITCKICKARKIKKNVIIIRLFN